MQLNHRRRTSDAQPHTLSALASEALVRADDVAQFIGCSPRTVQRAGIPYVLITPRVRRYRVADVRAWISAHVQGAA